VGVGALRSLVALTAVAPFVALVLTNCSIVTSLDGLTGGSGETETTGDGSSPTSATDAGLTDPAGDATTVTPGTDATMVDPGTDATIAPGADATTSSDGGVIAYTPDAKADAGIADAHTDSAIRDSSAPLDSSRAVDSSAPDTGNGETLLFSDDFDTSGALPRGWDTIATDDGTLSLDTSISVSAPTSLRASIVGLERHAAQALHDAGRGGDGRIRLRRDRLDV
jgi:hypothetical protein